MSSTTNNMGVKGKRERAASPPNVELGKVGKAASGPPGLPETLLGLSEVL